MRRVFLIIMCLLPLSLLAKDGSELVTKNYDDLFATFAGLIAVSNFMTEALKKTIATDNKLVVQVFSWLGGILGAFVGWALDLGMFVGYMPQDWYKILIIGILASLASNGVYDTGVLNWLSSKVPRGRK